MAEDVHSPLTPLALPTFAFSEDDTPAASPKFRASIPTARPRPSDPQPKPDDPGSRHSSAMFTPKQLTARSPRVTVLRSPSLSVGRSPALSAASRRSSVVSIISPHDDPQQPPRELENEAGGRMSDSQQATPSLTLRRRSSSFSARMSMRFNPYIFETDSMGGVRRKSSERSVPSSTWFRRRESEVFKKAARPGDEGFINTRGRTTSNLAIAMMKLNEKDEAQQLVEQAAMHAFTMLCTLRDLVIPQEFLDKDPWPGCIGRNIMLDPVDVKGVGTMSRFLARKNHMNSTFIQKISPNPVLAKRIQEWVDQAVSEHNIPPISFFREQQLVGTTDDDLMRAWQRYTSPKTPQEEGEMVALAFLNVLPGMRKVMDDEANLRAKILHAFRVLPGKIRAEHNKLFRAERRLRWEILHEWHVEILALVQPFQASASKPVKRVLADCIRKLQEKQREAAARRTSVQKGHQRRGAKQGAWRRAVGKVIKAISMMPKPSPRFPAPRVSRNSLPTFARVNTDITHDTGSIDEGGSDASSETVPTVYYSSDDSTTGSVVKISGAVGEDEDIFRVPKLIYKKRERSVHQRSDRRNAIVELPAEPKKLPPIRLTTTRHRVTRQPVKMSQLGVVKAPQPPKSPPSAPCPRRARRSPRTASPPSLQLPETAHVNDESAKPPEAPEIFPALPPPPTKSHRPPPPGYHYLEPEDVDKLCRSLPLSLSSPYNLTFTSPSHPSGPPEAVGSPDSSVPEGGLLDRLRTNLRLHQTQLEKLRHLDSDMVPAFLGEGSLIDAFDKFDNATMDVEVTEEEISVFLSQYQTNPDVSGRTRLQLRELQHASQALVMKAAAMKQKWDAEEVHFMERMDEEEELAETRRKKSPQVAAAPPHKQRRRKRPCPRPKPRMTRKGISTALEASVVQHLGDVAPCLVATDLSLFV